MDQHGDQYPAGMDKPCEEYVDDGWCFVAVKTKVGQKKGVDPQPAQRDVDSKLPAGSAFDGHVQVAVQAALTGHLVLSTLHTNDAAGAITRMTDMGVESYKLAAAMVGVVAQRLVRTICPKCRTSYFPSSEYLHALHYRGDMRRSFHGSARGGDDRGANRRVAGERTGGRDRRADPGD